VKRFVVDARDPDAAIIAEAAALLRAGGVVAYPTDTLYGLAVDPRRDAAVRRLFGVKERDHSNAIALIAADTAQAGTAGVLGPDELTLARRFWPGPLTIVAPAAEGLSRWLTGELGTVGVRVPGHAVARALAAAFGAPITATSANLSGRPAASTADEAAAALEGRIDAVVDAGPSPGGPPSTIVEFTGGGPVLRRAGAVSWDRVLEALQP
jgi:L-threonylcarbamoyladenylate synthase